jgi:signal transduction histidine kinase
VDPNNLIREVLQIHEERFKEKGLRLDVNFGSDVGQVFLDPYRFQQVIRNLISNAIEASFQNGVIKIDTGIFTTSKTAQLTGELKAKEYFELKIRNGGRIVPPGELKRFFDPFYTTKEYGTGIGLTLCKKIVEDHNGSISVRSDAEGTVFTVWIPLKPIEMPQLHSVVAEGDSASYSEKNDAH